MKISPAERLLELAATVAQPRDKLVICPREIDALWHSRVSIALALHRKSKEFHLRAIVERWSMQRIVEELY